MIPARLFTSSLHERDALLGHDIFQTRVLAISAVTEVAMNRQHRFRYVHNLVRREKTDDIREAWIRLRVTMTAPHAAANTEVVTDELVVLDNRDKAEAVREQVHVVHRRNGEPDLELTRQIRFAVERINKVFILGASLSSCTPSIQME